MQFAIRPKQAVDNLSLVEGTKLFLRVCVPRNKDLNFKLKRQDPIPNDYYTSPDYLLSNKKTRLYDEYLLKMKKEKERAREMMKNADLEIDILKKYLDDEVVFLDQDRKKEKGITDEEVKKLQDLFKKDDEEVIQPLQKIVDEMKAQVQEEKVLEEKGVQDVDLDDVLDEDDGIKQGLKITYNNLLELEKELPIRIRLDVFFEEKLVFDEFGNPCIYESPIIDDHCPKLTLQTKKKKKIAKLDVPIDEVQYVLKHFPGYIELFKRTKNIFARFVVEEIVEEGKFKDKPKSFLRKHKVREVGWFIFKVTDLQMNIREGRFKNILYRIPKQKPPPNPGKDLKMTPTALDFTIELFEYTSKDKAQFSYRRRPKAPEEKKKENEIDRRPFIPNPNPAYSDVQFQKGAGIDFYVDQARYLPTSVTITKIMVRFVDSDLIDICDPTSKVAEITSKVFEPEFNYRTELRYPYFNPTTMAIITLYTVDVRDDEGKPSIVGYGFFPLFLDRDTKEQPEDQENVVS